MRTSITAAIVAALIVTAVAPLAATDSVGLHDPGTGLWYISDTEGDVTQFFFGDPGDYGVLGDWDCDGVATPGLYRQSNGFAYLRNSNTSGVADIQFFLGDPGDIPLAGDFDGDGCDSLSVYRPSTQQFFIADTLGSGGAGFIADYSFYFGDPGDSPVVGDWDGDGIDEIGLHRQSTGFFHWRNTLDTGPGSGSIFFGDPGDRFVSGDWGVVDGIDTPGVFRPSSRLFFFRYTLTDGMANASILFGSEAMMPLAGVTGDVVDNATGVTRSVPSVASELLSLLNNSRATECSGDSPLAPVSASGSLNAVALSHSSDMVVNGFFSHTSPTTGGPVDRLNAAGIPWGAMGENIAVSPSATAMHAAWMASPGHRANICNPAFGMVGIAAVDHGNGLLNATQLFTN